MRRWLYLALVLALTGVATAQQGGGLLPAEFAGWKRSASGQASRNPAAADPAHAAVLREYGFTGFEAAAYTRGDRKLQVRAARFADATGAYGAFTFYQQPQMQPESIGDQALSNGVRVLFYRSNVLVDVVFDRVTAMSAAELRELAEALPQPERNAARTPSLPSYLPSQGLQSNSVRYVLGPAGLAAGEAPLPADLVDFSRNPEIALGAYGTRAGSATLTLIAYPTPQIAAERLRALAAFRPPAAPGAPDSGLALLAKRTGPIVALVTGDASAAEAKTLLDQVNYDADITWNEKVYNPRDNIGNLIIGVFTLIGVLLLFTLVAGVSYGGLRILTKRLFPDRSRDVEIIQLHLRD